MIGKILAVVMCAAVCSAHMDCSNVETVFRGSDDCSGPVFREERIIRSEPIYRVVADDGIFAGGETVQQRTDSTAYPVLLSNNGPRPSAAPIIRAPPITAPTQERPIIRLPHPPIPRERVVSHKCTCTKTVIKPQIIQRVITVPKIQRYLRRGYRPIIENLEYSANARGAETCPASAKYIQEPIIVRHERRPECFPPQFTQVSSIC